LGEKSRFRSKICRGKKSVKKKEKRIRKEPRQLAKGEDQKACLVGRWAPRGQGGERKEDRVGCSRKFIMQLIEKIVRSAGQAEGEAPQNCIQLVEKGEVRKWGLKRTEKSFH